MCTVAFVPTAGGFLFGHNRDERLTRARGRPPVESAAGSVRFLAPGDPDGGGTWVAVNEAGLVLALLNGREADPAAPSPAVPRSRGQLLLDLIELRDAPSVEGWLASAGAVLQRTRGFDLVAVAADRRGGSTAQRFRWDGRSGAWDSPVSAPALFVSSWLSPEEVARARQLTWEGHRPWEGVTAGSRAAWLRCHEPERGPRSVCMHRKDAATVSRTLIEVDQRVARMWYRDGAPCNHAAVEHERILQTVRP